MIKKLRQKFIIITMCSLAIVFSSMIGIINTINYYQLNQSAEAVLSLLSQNSGEFPESAYHRRSLNSVISSETPFTTRYFTVVMNNDGTVVSINTGKIAAVSTGVAREYAQELFEKGKTKGYIKHYKYNKIDYFDNSMYIFLDCDKEINTFYSFLGASILVSLSGMILVFLLVLFFSRKAVRPVAESYEKQKRFITDASHEIKTPLAIIGANTEVLEMESGENEWTDGIKQQVMRLSSLTERLVFLSKMDEERVELPMEEFSLSDMVRRQTGEFVTLASSQGKTISLHIEKEISYCGNKEMLSQLMSILLDNAVKYSDEHGAILVSLRKNEKKIELTVKNTVASIEQGKLDMLFERFYRQDSSRNSETGGYGIGLSVAKAIVTAHKGKIGAKSEDGKSIEFRVFL
jgi:signal transduction histidine kinase